MYYYSDGDKYDGNWENNVANGYGVYTFSDGEKYEGSWKDDKKHGHGIYSFASGGKLEGNWQDDKKRGEFIYTRDDGIQFKRIYDNDTMTEETQISKVSTVATQQIPTQPEEVFTFNPPEPENKPEPPKKTEPAFQFDPQMIDALRQTYDRMGAEGFLKGGKALAMLDDLLVGDAYAKQRRRFRNAVESGATRILVNGDQSGREGYIDASVEQLIAYTDMAENVAQETILYLAEVLL